MRSARGRCSKAAAGLPTSTSIFGCKFTKAAHKLPPQKPKERADQLFLYLASFCSSRLRPSGLAIQRSAVSLVLCKVGCLSDSR
jgi:hypothetical protein